MVDIGATQTLDYKLFRGLNTRDDENNLPLGQTPFAQNFELTRLTGLKKKLGFEERFDEFDMSYSFMGARSYRTKNDDRYYVTVSYPNILSHNRTNGMATVIDSTLTGDGIPHFIPTNDGKLMMVDGTNAPRLIDDKTVSTVTWPPVYNAQNNLRLTESNNASTSISNPTTIGTDIGYPSVGVFYENRIWLAGDKLAPYRIYASKVFNYTNFSDNTSATDFNVAFFVDVQANSPIVCLKVISDKFLVIYCEREILVLTGKFPPGTAYPDPKFNIDSLNQRVGAIGNKLVTEKGNNDHFFMGSNGIVYNLVSTENFQDVKPLGLSGKIFPSFQGLTNDTLRRGKLINHALKGELQLYIPSENYLRYPDQRFLYNYSESQDEPEWSIDNGFGDFFLRDAIIDDEDNTLILVTPTKFLTTDSGTTYDGENIDMVYQLSTLDFGDPDVRKEIDLVTIYATNLGDTDVTGYFYHLWDNAQSSYVSFTIPASDPSVFGEAEFNTDSWQAYAGTSFNKIEFQISNKIGKIFKGRIRQIEAANIFIHSIIFRYKILGK